MWDELKVVAALEELRSQQPFNRGPSFESIVAFGTNGALPHYIPTPATNKIVDNSSLLTVDSGGQYLGKFHPILYKEASSSDSNFYLPFS